MKSSMYKIAVATFVALASLSPAMHAQIPSDSARIDVPFSFDYGTKHFAHGVYTLARTSANVLTLRSGDQAVMALVQTGWTPRGLTDSQVLFRKYGDRYFLAEVLIADGPDLTVIQSKAEKRAARELARRGSQAETLALVFLPERPFGK